MKSTERNIDNIDRMIVFVQIAAFPTQFLIKRLYISISTIISEITRAAILPQYCILRVLFYDQQVNSFVETNLLLKLNRTEVREEQPKADSGRKINRQIKNLGRNVVQLNLVSRL